MYLRFVNTYTSIYIFHNRRSTTTLVLTNLISIIKISESHITLLALRFSVYHTYFQYLCVVREIENETTEKK